MDDDRYVGQLADGRLATALLEVLEEELVRRNRAVDSRAYALMTGGKPLDPQMAVQLWAEKLAIRNLKQSLERKATRGKTAAEALNERGRLSAVSS